MMRKTIISATLSMAMLGTAGIAAFAQTNTPPANGMAGMAPADTTMPMQGMAKMPMPMQSMMPMMMAMMPMMMPMGGQSTAGMSGMASTAAPPQAVPADLEQKLDLLIKNMDALTARIQKLETPVAN